MIHAEHITFTYDGAAAPALRDVSLDVACGEFVAILGHNACGKSTLAKHFNALLPLQEGRLTVAGLDAADEDTVWELRRRVGMVFQCPDNQFVSTIVAEDVAFGLENYAEREDGIAEKVSAALAAVGMAGFERRSTHMLSGGQKQRVALAGVLAMDPELLIFDEATSMLDPQGRREVLDTIRRLHREERRTIVMITHYVEEALDADRVYLLHHGRLIGQGTPQEILTDPKLLYAAGLAAPAAVRAYYDLAERGIRLPRCPLTNAELVEELCRLQ